MSVFFPMLFKSLQRLLPTRRSPLQPSVRGVAEPGAWRSRLCLAVWPKLIRLWLIRLRRMRMFRRFLSIGCAVRLGMAAALWQMRFSRLLSFLLGSQGQLCYSRCHQEFPDYLFQLGEPLTGYAGRGQECVRKGFSRYPGALKGILGGFYLILECIKLGFPIKNPGTYSALAGMCRGVRWRSQCQKTVAHGLWLLLEQFNFKTLRST